MGEVDNQGLERAPQESQSERFIISSDVFSQERLKFIKQIGDELKRFPFYRVLTLKGSLAKGKLLTDTNAPVTDVNAGVFLDFDAIAKYSEAELRELWAKYKVDDKIEDGKVEVNEGKYNIFSSQNLSAEALSKLRFARHAVRGFILGKGEKFFKDPKSKPKGLWPEISIFSGDGPFSIASTLHEYETSPDQSIDARIAVTRALSLPFGLLINGALSPYLQAFFNQLDKLDSEVAEQKWQSVRKAIVQNERWGSVPPAIESQIPRNVEEAKDMYLNNTRPHVQ